MESEASLQVAQSEMRAGEEANQPREKNRAKALHVEPGGAGKGRSGLLSRRVTERVEEGETKRWTEPDLGDGAGVGGEEGM